MADTEDDQTTLETTEIDENAPQEGEEGQTETQETPEKRTPWFQKRINELTAARRASDAAASQLARENEALKAMLPTSEGHQTPPVVPTDFEAAVSARAEQIRRTEEFNRASSEAYDKGVAAFPGKFPGAIANLQAAGVLTADNTSFIEAALATESPERVLYELGNNPDEAMRLASMPPAQLAVALDRMARAMKDKPVSDTPAPITPLASARVAKSFDAADVKTTDMKTWLAEREKQVAANKR